MVSRTDKICTRRHSRRNRKENITCTDEAPRRKNIIIWYQSGTVENAHNIAHTVAICTTVFYVFQSEKSKEMYRKQPTPKITKWPIHKLTHGERMCAAHEKASRKFDTKTTTTATKESRKNEK